MKIPIYSLDSASTCMETLGGKGANLARMFKLGLPVPAALIIPTTVCRDYMADPKAVMSEIRTDTIPKIAAYFTDIGEGSIPLLSVRSGAKFSMPGMMDTILNVGLHPGNFQKWQDRLGEKCAQNCWVRLQDMYLGVVKVAAPDTLEAQLEGAIEAVFKSWNNDRAKTYRKLHNIPDDLGTAVIIQQMVFGNLNDKSCTGVLFTRNPSTGEDEITGEFLVNAQGEDVVAGTVTPSPLHKLKAWNPTIAKKLAKLVSDLEFEYTDMLDVEFTVEDGKLYILQCRVGKRTAKAAIVIAMDLYKNKRLSAEQALKRVSYHQYLAATRPMIDPAFDRAPHATGIAASVGVASGVAVFSAQEALDSTLPCILLAQETTPDDIAGMNASVGILTSTGGATSHAAVVARGMNKVCVVGCGALQRASSSQWQITSGDVTVTIKRGTKITLDGATGRVWVNRDVPIVNGKKDPVISEFSRLVHEVREFYEVITDPTCVKPRNSWFPLYLIEDQPLSKVNSSLGYVVKKMESGVIDLRFCWQVGDPSDVPYYSMMDLTYLRQHMFALVVDALPDVGGLKDIWVVLHPGDDFASAYVPKLKDKGYKILPWVNTVLSLLLSTERGLVDPVAMSMQDPAVVKRIHELKAKAGEVDSAITIYTGDEPAVSMGGLLAMTSTAALKLSLAS